MHISHIRSAHGKIPMDYPLLVLLLGVCFFHWTTATLHHLGPSLLELNDGLLKNVTLLINTSDLGICGMGFTEIAVDAFDTVTHIERLDLSDNSIESLPPNIFSKLSNLERLSLANNKLNSRRFYKSFIGLNKLRRLTLSDNNISFLGSDTFIGLPNSATVIIRRGFCEFNFHGYTVPKEDVQENSSFHNYTVQKKNVKESAERIPGKRMPANSRIQLCKNNDTVDSLSELKKEDALATNCSVIRGVRNRSKIRLIGQRLRSFNPDWYKLAAYDIHKIDLSYNMLHEISPHILNDLTVPLIIDLRYNGISVIKKNIMENTHCMGLWFGEESLRVIEDGAFEKLCLTKLVIKNSNLGNLNFIWSLPVMIQNLAVINSKITEIPYSIFEHLNRLESIDLSSNRLRNIEVNVFSGLLNIRDIVLDHNEIVSIAEGSFSNVSLDHLGLNYNKITGESIRKNAFLPSNIEILELTHNLMTSFDEELFHGISNDCWIKLDNNPIISIVNLNYRGKISHQDQ